MQQQQEEYHQTMPNTKRHDNINSNAMAMPMTMPSHCCTG